jgi:AcrR family transcriptional regulator
MARHRDPTAKVKLLAAAEQVFVARGLDRAKVEEIALRAGLAKGSFYLHFATKEDAFRHVVEAMMARLSTYLDGIPTECPRQARDIPWFLDYWVTKDLQVFEFIWQNRGLMGLLLEGGKSAAYRHLVDRFADGARLRVRSFLASGIALGIYRGDLDVDLASAFIAGAYDRLARQLVQSRQRPDLDAILRGMQSLVLRGVGSASTVTALDRLEQPPAIRPKRSPTATATRGTERSRKRAAP